MKKGIDRNSVRNQICYKYILPVFKNMFLLDFITMY